MVGKGKLNFIWGMLGTLLLKGKIWAKSQVDLKKKAFQEAGAAWAGGLGSE